MSFVSDALTQATRHHQAGQLAEAERLYRQILDREPTHAQTLHQLGTLAIQAGQLQSALELITAAIRQDRSRADSYANLAEVYRRLGDTTQAVAHVTHAIKLRPSLSAAHAILGEIRQQQGDLAAAAAAFRDAVRMDPENAGLRGQLGEALFALKQLTDAEACFRRASRIAPDDLRMRFYLGSVLQEQHRLDEAIAVYQELLTRNADHLEAHINLGAIYKSRLALAAAETHFREALRVAPNHAMALSNLGSVLSDRGAHLEALACCQQACRLNPRFSPAFYNAGCSLYHLQRFDEAIGELRQAIALDPQFADAEMQLGNCYRMLGRMSEAISHYRRAVEMRPGDARAHSNLLYALNFDPGQDPATTFEEHLEWGRRHAEPLTADAPPPLNDRAPSRRVRIGYVSAHFCAHAVNFFSEPILAAHDQAACEIYCYSDVAAEDVVTQRLKPYADHWRPIAGLSDAEVEALVRRDGIDILVDLAGHIFGNRLLLFARKPAPVQVTYIGYQNTTGMRAMDYRLTDAWSDPADADSLYTERLVRLPRTFFCYRPDADALLAEAPPAVANGFVTFGSFNDFAKITAQVLDVWGQILRSVPGSRLLLLIPPSDSVRRSVLEQFARHDVGSQRIDFVHRCPRPEYLARISQVDVALDPFPFNGHTTTCDTLWMGVPVVMMAGNAYASRFGSSALATLGFTDWVAQAPEQYVEIAACLAGDIERLREWRHSLRPLMQSSPLCDATTFTGNLEAAYRHMWAEWCATGKN